MTAGARGGGRRRAFRLPEPGNARLGLDSALSGGFPAQTAPARRTAPITAPPPGPLILTDYSSFSTGC